MAFYDWLTYNEWWIEVHKINWDKVNMFIELFIFISCCNLILLICKYLTNFSINRYFHKIKHPKSLFSYQTEPGYLSDKLDSVILITFCPNFFSIIFTLIFVVKIIIKFIT